VLDKVLDYNIVMARQKFIIVGVCLLILAGFVYFFYSQKQTTTQSISNFQECVAAGNPVMESFPEQCRTQDGQLFVNEIAPATGEPIRVKGEVVCLPHKDTDGPQTLECAYGLKSTDGKYYALRDSDPEYKNLSLLPTGEVAVVSGTLFEDPGSKYDTVGVIEIQMVEN
jgi:hypothetical protein